MTHEQPKKLDLLLCILDSFLTLTLLILPLAWFFDPFRLRGGPLSLSVSWGIKPLIAPALLFGLRLWLRKRKPDRIGFADHLIFKQCCLGCLIPFFFVVILNQIAAWSGVLPTPDTPIVITGQEHLDTVVEDNRVVRDPELLFAFNPNITWDGYRVNEHGFRTRMFEAEKPAGMIRVICIGDSCTAQGRPPYSDRLHEMLQTHPPTDAPWEAFNTAVYGYSLMQGYRQFLRYGPRFEPDIVTIYFGWNDHWLYGIPDHKRMAVRMGRIQASLIANLREKPLFTFLASLSRPPVQQYASKEDDPRDFRVPPDVYMRTLADLIEAIRDLGAMPIVITAPRRELHPSLVKGGHARHPDEAEEAHDHYVEMTRQIAVETDTPLLDLAKAFEDPQYDDLFTYDGIHFESAGLQEIAERLYAKLMELAAEGRFDHLPRD